MRHFLIIITLTSFLIGLSGNLFGQKIFSAIEKGDLNAVRKIIETDPTFKINDDTEFNETALMVSAKEGHLEIVKFLIQKGATVEIQNDDGYSAIHFACKNGNLEIVKYLVSKGANIKSLTDGGKTTLMFACSAGSLPTTKYLVAKGVNIHTVTTSLEENEYPAPLEGVGLGNRDETQEKKETKKKTYIENHVLGKSALWFAKGRYEITAYLLSLGLTVNNINGTAALITACQKGDLSMVTSIVEKGVDIDKGIDNDYPLTEALRGGFIDIAQLLIQKGAELDNHQLLFACQRGSLSIVKIFLEKGFDVNTKGYFGEPLFVISCRQGHLELAKFLLAQGADTKLKLKTYDATVLEYAFLQSSKSGHLEVVKYLISLGISLKDPIAKEAINYAAENENVTVIKYLIDNGVNIFNPSKDYQKAFFTACSYARLNVVQYLVEHGADVNGLYGSYTPLINLLIDDLNLKINDRLNIVKYLVEHGADVNGRSKEGSSPINYSKYKEITKYLIEKGADVNNKGEFSGQTPLMNYTYEGDLEMVELLIKKGANINDSDKFGETALLGAIKSGHIKIVQYLVEKGADIHLKNSRSGYNAALSTAYDYKQEAIAEYLISKGAIK